MGGVVRGSACCTVEEKLEPDWETGQERGGTNVGDANGLGLACPDQLLHLLPCVDVVVRVDDVALAIGELGKPVVVAYRKRGQQPQLSPKRGKIPRTHPQGSSTTASAITTPTSPCQQTKPNPPNTHTHADETYHQEEIDIIQPQLLQALLQPQLDARRVRRPHLGHDEDVLALDARGEGLGQPLPDLLLVGVAVRAVDQLVPGLERVRDGLPDLARLGLPCAWPPFC